MEWEYRIGSKQYLDRRGKKYLELTRVDTLDLKKFLNVIKKRRHRHESVFPFSSRLLHLFIPLRITVSVIAFEKRIASWGSIILVVTASSRLL